MAFASDDTATGYNPTPPMGTNTAQRGMQYDPSDPMNLPIFLGTRDRPKSHYDAREAKVADQLGETYGGYLLPDRQLYSSVGQMLADFDTWSRKDFLYNRNLLAAAGYASLESDPITVKSAYAAALQDAAMAQVNNPKLTFKSYLDNLIRMSGKDPSSLSSSSGQPKRWKQTNTQKTIYELDPAEAKAMMMQTLQTYLGRDPTKVEIQDYMNAVQTKAKDDPSVVRSTTQYTRGGKDSETTREVLESGFTSADAEMLAMEKAKNAPGYGEYQAVSTYFPMLESLLSAPV